MINKRKKAFGKVLMRFVVALVVCHSAGLIGSIYTAGKTATWYATLVKPELAPPNWVFAPVWLTLYTLMAVSLVMLWHRRKMNGADSAITLFVVGLMLNALWSALFFGMERPDLAFVDIIALWGSILLLILGLAVISRRAAYLLMPYLIWVIYASVLNLQIIMLN